MQRLCIGTMQTFYQHLGDLGRDVFASGGYGTYGGDEFGGIPCFVKVALGARAQVLPQDLSHQEINTQLGLDNAYTRQGEAVLRDISR